MIFDLLQLAGGFILSFGYVPQIIQIIKTRSASDLNLKTRIRRCCHEYCRKINLKTDPTGFLRQMRPLHPDLPLFYSDYSCDSWFIFVIGCALQAWMVSVKNNFS